MTEGDNVEVKDLKAMSTDDLEKFIADRSTNANVEGSSEEAPAAQPSEEAKVSEEVPATQPLETEAKAQVPERLKGKSAEELKKIISDQETFINTQTESIDQLAARIEENNRKIGRLGAVKGEKLKEEKALKDREVDEELTSRYEQEDIDVIEKLAVRAITKKQEAENQARQQEFENNKINNLRYEEELRTLSPKTYKLVIDEAYNEVKKNNNLLFENNWFRNFVAKKMDTILENNGRTEIPVKKGAVTAPASSRTAVGAEDDLLKRDDRSLSIQDLEKKIHLLSKRR
jgi:hypothetical protein